MPTDERAQADLAAFARVELESGDIEPWAAVLRELLTRGLLNTEQAAWAVKLYNAHDDLGSAFKVAAVFGSPQGWAEADPADQDRALRGLTIGTERRNLRGAGLMRRHLDSYVAALHGQAQYMWLREAIPLTATHSQAFNALHQWMRAQIWGTGRLAAFEWAEFAGKVLGMPVMAGDGLLWESSGPRESLERIYNGGAPAPSQEWLEDTATACRDLLWDNGAKLAWWDFETVICDFNVMRKGRYYPGKHLAMVADEISGLPAAERGPLMAAFRAVTPWSNLPPGVNKPLAASYARDGLIRTPFGKFVS